MTFNIGDLVRIVPPPVSTSTEPYELIGRIGTITGLSGREHAIGGPCWDITLADGEFVWASQMCLRLIPGDSEGRKVVDWNWRDLVAKRPSEIAQIDLETR